MTSYQSAIPCLRTIMKSTLPQKMFQMRQPGIEPGAQQWECWILPLNHWRNDYTLQKYYL